MASPVPVVGEWYRGLDGALFEIVAIDAAEGAIELQHYDGTVEEIDADVWLEQEFEAALPPKDWIGSVDVEPEDYEGPTEAESLAQRALYASMLGSLFPPLQLYTLYLLSRYFAEAKDETTRTKRLVLGAVLLLVPSLGVVAIILLGS